MFRPKGLTYYRVEDRALSVRRTGSCRRDEKGMEEPVQTVLVQSLCGSVFASR